MTGTAALFTDELEEHLQDLLDEASTTFAQMVELKRPQDAQAAVEALCAAAAAVEELWLRRECPGEEQSGEAQRVEMARELGADAATAYLDERLNCESSPDWRPQEFHWKPDKKYGWVKAAGPPPRGGYPRGLPG
jgi:hypothetical protein